MADHLASRHQLPRCQRQTSRVGSESEMSGTHSRSGLLHSDSLTKTALKDGGQGAPDSLPCRHKSRENIGPTPFSMTPTHSVTSSPDGASARLRAIAQSGAPRRKAPHSAESASKATHFHLHAGYDSFWIQNWYIPAKVSGLAVSNACQRSRSRMKLSPPKMSR
jgi:hypothetical protein